MWEMEGGFCTIFRVLSGQHLPFLSKNPLFKGIPKDQHLPYTSLRPPVTPPIFRLLSCTGGLWEVYGRCCTKTSRLEVPLYKGVSKDLGRCWPFFTHSFIFSVSLVSLADNCINIHSCYLSCWLGLSLGQTRTFVRGNSHFPASKPPVPCLLSISGYIFIFLLPSK